MASSVVKRMLTSWSKARSFSTAHKAHNVGILAAETYISSRAVNQEALETFTGASAGKYTVGLGQKKMAFVDDREDINSIAMTAVQRLLDNYGIDPKQIGRLEVGTESLVDKSKSTKTTLMQLFEASGNRDIEGATVMNACYGGTAALFNSAAWVESSEWDGRYAIFVAADIAVYEEGPARPTGGVGAVAMLVGPGAPLRLVPRCRATHAVDVYDFYKPSMSSEYPAVDGKLSQSCYIRAVDDAYNLHLAKQAKHGMLLPRAAAAPAPTAESAFDHLVFHSPYNKLVQQSFKRMLFNDAKRLAAAGAALPAGLAPLAPYLGLAYKETLANKELDKALSGLGGELYERMVGPTVGFSQQIGNSYTGAVYTNLVGTVDALGSALTGKRVGVFSYGSGAIASMFALEGAKAASEEFSLARMQQTVQLQKRLAARREASPQEFTEALKMRERAYGKAGFKPAGSLDNVPAGAWYLKEVQANHNRVYERKA